ncbi:MAG: endonuclease/exonuclease/phosphatase family protein [Flavisolibacter sp.]
MAHYRRFTKFFFIAFNSAVAVIFLLACLGPYLNPKKWWPISLMGLGLIFIVITLIAFIFFWLIFRPRFMLISLIALGIGYKSIIVFFGFHISDKFDYIKQKDALRIAHWNVARFIEWKRNNNKGSQTRLKMMDQIKEQNADVLCFQEFFTSTDSQYYDNLKYIKEELGYPYHYFSHDEDGYLQWYGQVIFSKYPLIDTGMVRYPRPSLPEALIHADIVWNGDTIRIYTTHLQSVQFQKHDFETIDNLKNNNEIEVKASRGIFSKLKRGVINRAGQADLVRQEINKSPYPFVLTGDFNDVPNSYTYFTIKDNDLQDAFLMTGFGVGRTYYNIAPALRIDYMLTTKNFEVKQFNRIIKNYSDHYMLVADVQLNKTPPTDNKK